MHFNHKLISDEGSANHFLLIALSKDFLKDWSIEESEHNLLQIGLGKNYKKDRSIDYSFLLRESRQLVEIFQYAEGNQNIMDGLAGFIGKNSVFFKEEDSEILLHHVFKPICLLYDQLLTEYAADSKRNDEDYCKLIFESINPYLENLLFNLPTFIETLEYLNKILAKTDEKIYVFKLFSVHLSQKHTDLEIFDVTTKMIFPSLKHSINPHQSIALQLNLYVLFPDEFKINHTAIATSIAILEEVFKDNSRYLLDLVIPMFQYLKYLGQETNLIKYLCLKMPSLIRIHDSIVAHYKKLKEEERTPVKLNKVFSSLKNLLINKPLYFKKLESFAHSGEMLGIGFYNHFNILNQSQDKLSQ